MDAIDLLDWATLLLASDQEVRLRAAVSRAYYGVFHAAREFVENCGVVVPGADVHDKLYWCLQNAAEPSLVEAGTKLGELRRYRNRADYDLATTIFRSRHDVRLLIELAVSVFVQLRGNSVEKTPAQVRRAVQEYAGRVLMWQLV